MAIRPALRASGCFACRSTILRLCLSPPTAAASPAPFRRRPTSTQPSAALLSRSCLASARLYSSETTTSKDSTEADDQPGQHEDAGAELETASALEAQPEADTAEKETPETPWYLQEEPPRHPTLVSDALALPKAPKNSPAILERLIKFVAEDAGLDDLSLMDLRTLNPPAALGPSLIMLFGTARTDRHLHKAASSVKTWLRRDGINASADGLVGNKKLKILARRKARKAKLLGISVPADEASTTRWVCLNLGTIGSAPDSDEVAFEAQDGSLRGFGIQRTGTTIVVQMMTESKRKELGLEKLWSQILARRGDSTVVEDDLEYPEADAHPNEVSLFQEGASDKTLAVPSQRRFFSTSCRRLVVHDEDQASNQVTDQPQSISPGDYFDTSLDPVSFPRAMTAELRRLQADITSLPDSDAVEALSPPPDGHPRGFLKQWNQAIKFLPLEQSWQYRLWLAVRGRSLGAPFYSLSHLRDLVDELQLSGTICQRTHYLDLLRTVYAEPAGSAVSLKAQSEMAEEILNVMFERGETLLATDVIVSLLESLARTASPSEQTREMQNVLNKLMQQADLPFMGEAALLRLLNLYAAQGYWDQWKELWQMPPKHQRPRSYSLYLHMWTAMAATQDRDRCRMAVRTYYDEMLHEDPPVRSVGQVRLALEACLRVADPDAEAQAKMLVVRDLETAKDSQLEFVGLWRELNPSWGLSEQ